MKYLCISLVIVALLILAVQIVTEIIKSFFNKKENTAYNIIVVVNSLIVTLITVIAAAQIVPFRLSWYIVAASVIGSFFIAYGAMFGYDKLFKRVFDTIKNAVNSYFEIKQIGGNENEKK